MTRFLVYAALAVILTAGLPALAGDKEGARVKPLPDGYKQFKLGTSRKLLERKVTPEYTVEPAPDAKIMVVEVKGTEIHGILLVLWKEKLASITLVFQEGYTLERVKASLVKTYGEPSKADPIETVWVDSKHVMALKFEYSIMDMRNRVTVSYTDIGAYQEIKESVTKGRFGLGPGKGRGKGDVPPQ
ncbi:MAG: hypothetical protein AB1696_24225 [Planctomycetota bacterium]